jgi:hypothetical protein
VVVTNMVVAVKAVQLFQAEATLVNPTTYLSERGHRHPVEEYRCAK